MKNKHLLTLSTLALTTAALLSGCGNKVKDDENTLEIFVVNAGYKTAWCYSIKDAFIQQDYIKEKFPNLNVVIHESDNQQYGKTRLDAGKSSNTIDLFFDIGLIEYNGKEDLLDITDSVYNAKVPGEEVLFKDKISKSYYDSFKYDGQSDPAKKDHLFFAPWAGGMTGILYNSKFYNDCGYTVPNTTDELLAICADYKSKHEGYSFLQGNDEGYFNYLFDVFWTQYQSIEGYDNFWNGIDDGARSRNIFRQKGRLEALKVYENLVKYSNGYVNPNSINQNFATAQQLFLKGQSLMNVNGDWFVSEMKDVRQKIEKVNPQTKDYVIKMMKTPIISAIKDVLPGKTVESDAELSALVKAIDAHNTSLTGEGYNVSQIDYDYVKEARSITYSIGAGHQACIPSYAKAKDLAVEFIRFMATDQAQEIYIRATDGASMPFSYDLKAKNPTLFNEIDILHQDRINYFADTFVVPHTLKDKYLYPLCHYGNVDTFRLSNGYDFFTQMGKESGAKTAQQYYDETITYWSQEGKWDTALESAGLK